jgi:hypothetical protein
VEVSGNAVFLGTDISAGITGVLTDISADITRVLVTDGWTGLVLLGSSSWTVDLSSSWGPWWLNIAEGQEGWSGTLMVERMLITFVVSRVILIVVILVK